MLNERSWLGLTLEEMEQAFISLGEGKFRGRQLADWIYKKGSANWDKITNFSIDLRQRLAEEGNIGLPRIELLHESKRDPVWKALVGMDDDAKVECVLMRYSYGNTTCISTQVGCRMGCSFCASGRDGLVRNLTAGEMIGQVIALRNIQPEMRISHIVLMGMGEPLDNLLEVKKMMAIANASWGLGIGYRHITLSTCGLVPQMDDLRKLELPINLSISLHAPNDQLRSQIMPIAKRYDLQSLMQACRRYVQTTRRRITFEYSLMRGFNDQPEHAKELAGLLKGLLAHVNVIPLNQVEGSKWRRSQTETIREFAEILQEAGVETTIRREMGSDILAACGQLRLAEQQGKLQREGEL